MQDGPEFGHRFAVSGDDHGFADEGAVDEVREVGAGFGDVMVAHTANIGGGWG